MKTVAHCLMALSLGGCAWLPRSVQPDTPADAPPPLKAPERAQVVNPAPEGLPAQTSLLTVAEDVFVLRPQELSDPVPNIQVPAMSFSNASPFEMIRAVVESVNLGVALVGEHPNAHVQRGSVTAWNIGGPLPAVLQRLSQYTGLFHHYKDGVLTFTPDAQFMTTLPPVEDLIDPLAGVVRSLGGMDVQVDRFNRILSFRANRMQLPRIEAYLKFARERRQVITYDVSIYEVQLSDGTQMGVNWNRFALGGGRGTPWYQTQPQGNATGTSAQGVAPAVLPDWMPFRGAGTGEVAQGALNITGTSSGGMTVNPFFVLPGLSADVLMNFLQTQGTLRSISQPRVSMLTGSKAAVRVGSTTTYVSKIGTNTGSAVTSTSVETAQLKTGVDLRINADYQDGTVFTDLQIAINDLVRMRSYVALGTTLQLPDTSDRLIETKVRARPGDTIVIGGIQRDNQSHDADGAPLPGGKVLPTQRNKQALRSELVITLLPRVVNFTQVVAAPKQPVAHSAVSEPATGPATGPVTRPASGPATEPRRPVRSLPPVEFELDATEVARWGGMPPSTLVPVLNFNTEAKVLSVAQRTSAKRQWVAHARQARYKGPARPAPRMAAMSTAWPEQPVSVQADAQVAEAAPGSGLLGRTARWFGQRLGGFGNTAHAAQRTAQAQADAEVARSAANEVAVLAKRAR